MGSAVQQGPRAALEAQAPAAAPRLRAGRGEDPRQGAVRLSAPRTLRLGAAESRGVPGAGEARPPLVEGPGPVRVRRLVAHRKGYREPPLPAPGGLEQRKPLDPLGLSLL